VVLASRVGQNRERERRDAMPARDPRVDEYLATLPDWQAGFGARVRAIVHEADPDVEETIKRGRLPYFVLQGNVCALLAARDHLNVFIYDPIAPAPSGLINQGPGNATARGIQLRQDDERTRTRCATCCGP
jgi:hypothetical protein